MEQESDDGINCNWGTQKGDGRVGNWRRNRYHPNYKITAISQNTEKSPGELRKFAVTQTPVNDH